MLDEALADVARSVPRLLVFGIMRALRWQIRNAFHE